MKSKGLNLCDILATAFIILKLGKFINLSWLWVISPWLIELLIYIIIILFLRRKNINGKI